jgi:hypothetical protein|tara:strand:+ start:373 stop:594 length:222 start_codon:yes stop_codon:yes gene_type:complete
MAKIYDKFGKPLGYSNATGLPSHQSKGLGDTVEKFTKATGIKKVVDTVSKAMGKDCGCKGRKDKLNKAFPYKK